MLKSGDAVLVDVRTDEQYTTQHAVGSIHIPYTQLATRLNELPPGKYVIAYCS
jgi:rhodanese-related sulfurtransferase